MDLSKFDMTRSNCIVNLLKNVHEMTDILYKADIRSKKE